MSNEKSLHEGDRARTPTALAAFKEDEWEFLSASASTMATRSPSVAALDGQEDKETEEFDDLNFLNARPHSPTELMKRFEVGKHKSEEEALTEQYKALTIEQYAHASFTNSTRAEKRRAKRRRKEKMKQETETKQERQEEEERPETPKAAIQRIHEATCELCEERIRGERWLCKDCPAWSVCGMCINLVLVDNDVHPSHTLLRILQPTDVIKLVPRQSLPSSGSFHIPQEEPLLHKNMRCSTCKGSIVGARYECAVLSCRMQMTMFCETCEALPINAHPPSHPLLKFKRDADESAEVGIPALSGPRVASETNAPKNVWAGAVDPWRPFDTTEDVVRVQPPVPHLTQVQQPSVPPQTSMTTERFVID